MQINPAEPITQTLIFTIVLVVILLIFTRRRGESSFLPISLTNELKGLAILGIMMAHIGYLGRTGIYEVLIISVKMANLILQRATLAEFENLAIEEGMITLKQDGYLKALEGLTTLEEVLRVAQD